MITRGEMKRLQRLSRSHIKSEPDNRIFEVVIVDHKGKQKTIGQLAASAKEARRKLKHGGARVLRVGKPKKELAFALKHRIYNGMPYEA